jgi:uncharacterized protein YcbK (DUF882 family)
MGEKLTAETFQNFARKNGIKYFKFSDFVKEPEGFIDSDLVLKLEKLREATGFKLIITSGYRSEEKNKEVGGAKHSLHLEGKAVDIATSNISPNGLYQLIKNAFLVGFTGIIIYPGHVHLDIRPLDFFALGSYNK